MLVLILVTMSIISPCIPVLLTIRKHLLYISGYHWFFILKANLPSLHITIISSNSVDIMLCYMPCHYNIVWQCAMAYFWHFKTSVWVFLNFPILKLHHHFELFLHSCCVNIVLSVKCGISLLYLNKIPTLITFNSLWRCPFVCLF